jgi:predicted MFS family arabinose efflux permease
MAESNSSTGMNARYWTRNQAMAHPLFWFMVPALLGPSAFGTAFFFHQVHIAEVKNWSHVELVALFPIYTGMGIVAMILSGWALDRFGTARLMPFIQLPMAASFVVFAYAAEPIAALFGFMFFAMTTGSHATMSNAFWAEFYGTAHIGSIKAMAAAVMVLGSALGPGITGFGIDLGIGIETQFLWIAGYFLLTTISMMIGIGGSKGALPA